MPPSQGCQICIGTTYPNGKNIPQMTTNYAKWPLKIQNGSKIDRMAIQFTSILHCRNILNLPKFGFLV
jgi:hypothetical protein